MGGYKPLAKNTDCGGRTHDCVVTDVIKATRSTTELNRFGVALYAKAQCLLLLRMQKNLIPIPGVEPGSKD